MAFVAPFLGICQCPLFSVEASRELDRDSDPHNTAFGYVRLPARRLDRPEGESSTFEEKCKVSEIAKQKAWERLYERWPELKGKV